MPRKKDKMWDRSSEASGPLDPNEMDVQHQPHVMKRDLRDAVAVAVAATVAAAKPHLV